VRASVHPHLKRCCTLISFALPSLRNTHVFSLCSHFGWSQCLHVVVAAAGVDAVAASAAVVAAADVVDDDAMMLLLLLLPLMMR
jgi:hypothetical protein